MRERFLDLAGLWSLIHVGESGKWYWNLSITKIAVIISVIQ